MDDNSKSKQLKHSKRLATGLFLLMVIIYCITTWLSQEHYSQWIGYLKAFSEAGMVGALADWFAVTALFHHPLGLRIPHTNLIEKSKQKIGNNLGDFVVSNFLSPANIKPYIQKISVVNYIIRLLEKEKNKAILQNEIRALLKDIVEKLDDAQISAFLARNGESMTRNLQLHHLSAQALKYLIDKKEHEQFITLLAKKIKTYIHENEKVVRERVKEESYFFIPKFIDKKLAEKIVTGLVKYFEEIETDPRHIIRSEIANELHKFIEDLKTNPKWEKELSHLKDSLLSEEQFHKYAADVWQMFKKMIYSELSDNRSALSKYFSKTIDEIINNLKNDQDLRKKIDHWIRHNAYKLILNNTTNVAKLISNTVGDWEGRDLSTKLELEVGKDLQFIRINGTIVGGLVGLLIYTLTQLLT